MDLLIWLTWELLGKIHRSILLRETFSARLGGGGGVTQERFSNFSNNRLFQAEKLPEKPCQQRRILWAPLYLSQTSCLSLNKFGVGNYIPDCRSAPFAQTIVLLA